MPDTDFVVLRGQQAGFFNQKNLATLGKICDTCGVAFPITKQYYYARGDYLPDVKDGKRQTPPERWAFVPYGKCIACKAQQSRVEQAIRDTPCGNSGTAAHLRRTVNPVKKVLVGFTIVDPIPLSVIPKKSSLINPETVRKVQELLKEYNRS